MGTNYYWKPSDEALNIKGGTLRAAQLEPIHIGKHSGGWEFCFQAIEVQPAKHYVDVGSLEMTVEVGFELSIRSWAEWKAVLQRGGEIVDEYGEYFNLEAFIEIVEKFTAPGAKRSDGTPLTNQIDYLKRKGIPVNPEQDWLDEQGYSFTISRFS